MTPDEKKQMEDMRATAIARQGDIEEKEDEMYSGSAPKGKFSGKSLNALVDVTNRLLPLFGIKDAYDRFGGGTETTLPPEFVRILTMFSKAIEDAVAAGALPEDAMIDLTVVTDDSGLQSLAGRIGMAAKSPQFKRFLMRKVSEKGASETVEDAGEGDDTEAADDEEMSDSGMDKLFKSRM
jgi:hypothetical protein